MTPQILKLKCKVGPQIVPPDFKDNILDWLEAQAKADDLRWLLVHADDGVIWGELRNDKFHLSSDLFGPQLRAKTLQMARLFGFNGELFIWKIDTCSWQARLIVEQQGNESEYFDETMLLWGTKCEKSKDGFFLWRHGSEGLRHAPPIKNQNNLKLKVRHYIDYDEDGQAYIKFSRLVFLGENAGKEVAE
jgi:CRISPR-associated protein (TIGR03984 family)